MEYTIKTSTQHDLFKITHCFQSAFPKAQSSKLGKKFVRSMLSWYIESPKGILFHIEGNNEVLGLCGCSIVLEPGLPGAATCITQHSFKQFIRSFIVRPYLILHPDNLKRISFISRNILLKLGVIKKNNNLIVTHHKEKFEPSLGLVVIGVSNQYQGKGLGSMLLHEFEKQALKNDLKKVTLSVKKTNQQAIAAYKRNGWHLDCQVDDYLIFKKYL
jgi:hypothetical protein